MAVDLGFSNVIYAKTRSAFLTKNPIGARSLSVTTFGLYGLITAISVIAFSSQIHRFGPKEYELAFSLFFIGSVLPLPWAVIRAVTAATERYILFESIELFRRMGSLALACSMLWGLTFIHYAALNIALWAAAFIVMCPSVVRSFGTTPLTRNDWDVKAVLENNRRQIGASSAYSLAGFALVNVPYLAFPLLFHHPLDVIPFDIFSKVTRFGWQAYLVANEGILPVTSRAVYQGDKAQLKKSLRTAVLLSAIPCMIGIIAVTFFGDRVFTLLLKDASLITHSLRWGMGLMLIVLMFQAPVEIVMLNTGNIVPLARIRAGMVGVLALLITTLLFVGYTFDVFMLSYILIYFIGTVYFCKSLRLTVKGIGKSKP